jgi:arginine decarboxylase
MVGRIAAVMLVPYPPGIPMSMPGERLGGPESPVIKLILAMEQFGKRFPGFEREVHGIEVDEDGHYWMRAVVEDGDETPAVDPSFRGQATIEPHRLTNRPVRHSTE